MRKFQEISEAYEKLSEYDEEFEEKFEEYY
jgi:hypothetical protein